MGEFTMKYKSVIFFGAILFGSLSVSNQAKSADFSLGGGLPYFVIPEVSFAANNGEKRWFANYKIGLDDGFSVGFEQGFGVDNKHALGIFVGALGVQDDERPCRYEESNDLAENFGSALGCAIAEAFDEETTNGVGLSYSYNFQGLNHSGMRLRFELGYGEGSNSHEKRFDGGVVISYQF